jgi:hypothetical protein
MRNVCLNIALATSILEFAELFALSQSAPKQKVQTHFSAEDEHVNHPVAIPAEVLALLAKDELVHDVLEDQKIAPADLPASWFSAAEIQLGGKGERDYIIASQGPLLGANIDPFWVIIHGPQGFKLALSTSTHDLIAKRTRSHGYWDLELDAMTASTITTARFRFDGSEYKEFREKTTDIK